MPSPRKVYLDSCVFLSYVNNDADRAPHIEALFDEARSHGTQLYTSELSIVEVAFGRVEQTQQALSPEVENQIDSLWMPGSAIRLIEYYRLIGDDAKTLMRLGVTKGWTGLRAMDAIHLSTARRMQVDEFHTYDINRLTKYSNDVGFPICEPYSVAPQLPGLTAT